MSKSHERSASIALTAVVVASATTLLLGYHNAILLPQPDSADGYVYAFPTKGGYRFTDRFHINLLSLGIAILIPPATVLVFYMRASKAFFDAFVDISFSGKSLLFLSLLYLGMTFILYFTVSVIANLFALNGIALTLFPI
jgi:hypothetical protein